VPAKDLTPTQGFLKVMVMGGDNLIWV